MSDNDSSRKISGPAVAAFDAETEAEDAGVLYTPDQWSFVRRDKAKSTNPVAPRTRRGDTVQMSDDQLRALTDACRAPDDPDVSRVK